VFLAMSLCFVLSWAVPATDFDYSPHSRAVKYGLQGADVIRGVGLKEAWTPDSSDPKRYLITSAAPGQPGLALLSKGPVANTPTFFIKNRRLFAYVNATTVLHVNVVDPSAKKPSPYPMPPLREGLMNVVLAPTSEGSEDGEWFFNGERLQYAKQPLGMPLREGSDIKQKVIWKNQKLVPVTETNDGLWWACEARRNYNYELGRVLYVDFDGYNFRKREAPAECEAFTLHSWGALG